MANLAPTSAFFSQTAGSAAVSPPVLEFSGNSDGILAAASWYCAKIAFALARSNGSSPFTYLAPNAACWPLAFISALRAAIGSCAIAVERPSARAAARGALRLIGSSRWGGAEARMKSWVDLEQPPDKDVRLGLFGRQRANTAVMALFPNRFGDGTGSHRSRSREGRGGSPRPDRR